MRDGARQDWERREGETARAYRAFVCFRDLGEERTIVGAAKLLNKSESLLRRWSARHGWWSRVQSWDLAQARESEAAVAQEREATLRRQWQDANRAQKLSMAKFSSLVIRDSGTGEPTLSSEVTVADAIHLYRLGLDIQRGQLSSTAPGDAEAADQPLETLSGPVLRQMIKLARERAETEQSQEAHEDEQQTKTNAEGDDPD